MRQGVLLEANEIETIIQSLETRTNFLQRELNSISVGSKQHAYLRTKLVNTETVLIDMLQLRK